MSKETQQSSAPFSLARWEFNVLVLESLLLGALLMAGVARLGPRILASAFPLADELAIGMSFAAGLLLIMLCFFAVLSIHARNLLGKRLSFLKMLAWGLVGSMLGGVLYTVLP